MNNETKNITEADVASFMQSKVKELFGCVGKYSTLSVSCGVFRDDDQPIHARWVAYGDGARHADGDTCAAAIESVSKSLNPATLAKAKREAAATLLAEADALSK